MLLTNIDSSTHEAENKMQDMSASPENKLSGYGKYIIQLGILLSIFI